MTQFVHILVEGQTEETFVRDTLVGYLRSKGVEINPILAVTKRVKSGLSFKGGVVSYGRVRLDLLRLLRDSSAARVTTLLDYYHLPDDFPGYEHRPPGSCFERVAFLEAAFRDDIADPRFMPYLALHEFEAMMFVSPELIAREFPGSERAADLQRIRAAFASPEEIDEENPPSKRLLALLPGYEKAFHGPLVTQSIGIARIRQACAHFSRWVEQLEALGA